MASLNYLRSAKRFVSSNSVEIHRLGQMSFLNASDIQKKLISEPKYASNDHLLFVEHTSVYTCGRRHFKDIGEYINDDAFNGSNQESINEFKGQIEKIDRGGNVTFHGKGQLVVYPIFDLKQSHFKKDLHWFLRTLENVIIDLLLSEYRLETGIRE